MGGVKYILMFRDRCVCSSSFLRYERLEEQLNDLTELHQNEMTNLKQELASMEEKVAYQSYERARDIQVKKRFIVVDIKNNPTADYILLLFYARCRQQDLFSREFEVGRWVNKSFDMFDNDI